MQYNFTKYGKGRAAVLVHGWGGDLGNLEKLGRKLAENGFSAYNLELAGFGRTPEPERPWEIRDFSNFVIDFCRSERIEAPIFVGHSFGGKIVLDIAAHRLHDLSGLVLIGADGIYPNFSLRAKVFRFASDLKQLLPGKLQDSLARQYYKYILKQINYIKTSDVMRRTLIKCDRTDFDRELGRIDVPTLIIWGANDKVTPLWMGELLNRGISGSKLVIVNESGHAIPLKHPDYTAELMSSWENEQV
ncbi:MAG: alpha/beta hydrolase [Acidobacteria bacterium]|nr:alpha/beta hydrolase [Acidobacteriota bacterium]